GLGELEWRSGRREDAIRTLVDFLVLDPTHVEALTRLGSWLAGSGRYAQAETALRRALRLDPDHPGARSELDRIGAATAARAAVRTSPAAVGAEAFAPEHG